MSAEDIISKIDKEIALLNKKNELLSYCKSLFEKKEFKNVKKFLVLEETGFQIKIIFLLSLVDEKSRTHVIEFINYLCSNFEFYDADNYDSDNSYVYNIYFLIKESLIIKTSNIKTFDYANKIIIKDFPYWIEDSSSEELKLQYINNVKAVINYYRHNIVVPDKIKAYLALS